MMSLQTKEAYADQLYWVNTNGGARQLADHVVGKAVAC